MRSRSGPDRPTTRRGVFGAARARSAAVLSLALLVVVAVALADADGTGSPAAAQDGSGPPVPAAMADSPWFPEYAALLSYSTTWLDVFRQVGFEKIRDARSDHLTVVDGVRRSWTPPECADCPRATVRFYGSATSFGLGQRDEHTIASEVARLAWADGIALDVVNRGMPGDQHWQQADRFAWDLTRHPEPDAVVFTSGVSEVNAARALAADGVGDVDRPDDPMAQGFLRDETMQQILDDALRGGEEDPPPPPEGVVIPEATTVAPLSPAEIGALTADRYASSLPMSADLVAHRGIPALWVWEPMRLSRPLVPGEPTFPDDDDLRTVVEAAQAGLPERVLDLSDALDDDPRPLFWDDVHSNEAAAAIVAREIWANLRPLLASAADGPTG